MLSGITSGLYGSVTTAVVSALAVAAVCYAVARRAGVRPWSWAGLGASLGVEASVTLLNSGGGALTRRCVVNHDLMEPFHTDQGLLNLVLFIPVGLFAALAIRALAPVAALVVLLPVATELLQSLVPAIGRLCDTSDMEMNAFGGLAGAAVGNLLLHATRRPLPAPGAGARRTAHVALAAVVTLAAVWMSLITQIPVDATSLQLASAQEKAAAHKAFQEAFGDRYHIVNVQLQPATAGSSAQLLIAFKGGSATLSWPDRTQLLASLESSSTVTQSSFAIPGVTTGPSTADTAAPIATRYAHEHFPWALNGSEVHSYPAGTDAEFGWIVSWRRRNAQGVLMPMRLDVEIDRGGRVSQLLVRHIADPTGLPPIKVSKATAQKTALAFAARSLADGTQPHANDSELLAVKREGTWHTQWLFSLQSGPSPVYVDATDGTPALSGPQQSVSDPGSATDQDQNPVTYGPPPNHS